MTSLFPGAGTVLNVVTVLLGAGIGMAVGHRLRERTRSVVTDALGLVTLLVAGAVGSLRHRSGLPGRHRKRRPGAHRARFAAHRLGHRIAHRDRESTRGAGRTRSRRLVSRRWSSEAGTDHAARERFIEGWLTASLLFCVGPLTILGALSDGLGRGIDQLALKSVLDGFAAMAFAASFGVGVLFSAVSVAVIQGVLTLVGVLLGSLVPGAHIAALTATGGLLLAGIALRLLRIRDIPVGDMLPALVVAPLLTSLVIAIR